MRTACTYCDHHGARCPALNTDHGEHHCTRPDGHDGLHVACGSRHEAYTWAPDLADAALDLTLYAARLQAAITRCRARLTAYARQPHEDHCDGDTPCTRDVAEEALAALEAP
ncbi:hypothetical protein ACTXL6_16390 [Brachybacterium tyrofermentans]|uniref:hypothetical protein n=1 Tax=Brachybacterium tyrofermentans TaxID=47848 RepID=UPI003FCFFD15